MITSENITASFAHICKRIQEDLQGLQIIVTLMAQDGMTASWHPIIKIYVSTSPEQLKPEHRPYIYIAFDFIPGHDLRRVVKISQRVKTSHFKEMISLN